MIEKKIFTMPISNIEENFEKARNRLLELVRKESIVEESTTEPRKIIVFSGVSLERYHKFKKSERKRFNIYVRLVKGDVIAYEIPSPVHGAVAFRLGSIIESWSNNQLIVISELDITVGNNSEYTIDIAAEPIQVPPPPPGRIPQPTIFVEVAKSESLGSLDGLTVDYFSNSPQSNLTQVYLAIKIFSRRQNGTAAMLALMYLRNNQIPNSALNAPNPPPNTPPMIALPNTIPNIVISFGSAPLSHQPTTFVNNTGIHNSRFIGFLQQNHIACTAPGMPNYQLTIPANLLFPGGVPVGTPNNFNIDLWEIQQRALYYLVCIGFALCCYIIGIS